MSNTATAPNQLNTMNTMTLGQRLASVSDLVRGIIYPKGTATPRISHREQAALDLHRDAWLGKRPAGLEKTVKSYSY